MKNNYKTKAAVGGICCTRCSGNGRVWIQATRNIDGLRNRFNFAMLTKTYPDPTMRAEWIEYGYESFSFTVLEELKKKDEQTDKEFSDDLDLLCEVWLEKSQRGDLNFEEN